jgi:hypothetical protein
LENSYSNIKLLKARVRGPERRPGPGKQAIWTVVFPTWQVLKLVGVIGYRDVGHDNMIEYFCK